VAAILAKSVMPALGAGIHALLHARMARKAWIAGPTPGDDDNDMRSSLAMPAPGDDDKVDFARP